MRTDSDHSQHSANFSFQSYLKAGLAFMATTATYFSARTTGLLPTWFRGDDSLSAEVADSSLVTQDALQTSVTQRRLLQTGVVVANPIPDQLIDVAAQYTYSLDNVFSGDFELLKAVETGQTVLPIWLSLQYKLVGSVSMPPSTLVKGVAVQNNTVFAAVDWAGLQAINISNPENPVIISSLNVGGYTQAIALQGNLAYVCKSTALQIVNVSNPRSLQLISTFNMNTTTNQDIAARSDGIVFVLDAYTGLKIINASNPVNPVLMSSFQPFNNTINFAVAVQDNWVVVGSSNYLLVINATNLYSPTVYRNYPGPSFDVTIQNNIVFSGINGLLIYNISLPTAISGYSSNHISGITVQNNIAFLADSYYGLFAIDISNLPTPKLIGGYNPSSNAGSNAVAVQDNLAIIASGQSLKIVDLHQGQLLGTPPSDQVGRVLPVSVSASNMNLTLLSNVSFALTIDDFPKSIYGSLQDQSFFPGNNTLTLNIDSNLLFRKSAGSLLKLSLSLSDGSLPPAWLMLSMQPLLLSSIGSFSGVGLEMAGTNLFIAGSLGFMIIDVSNPSQPSILNQYAANGNGAEVSVVDDVAYFLGTNGILKILNISNLASSQVIGSYNAGGSMPRGGIAIKNATAYLGAWSQGFQTVNISNISAPSLISKSTAFTPALGVALQEDAAFVCVQQNTLWVLDVKNVTAPRTITTYLQNQDARRIFIRNNIAFFSAGFGALRILNISNVSSPTALSTYVAVPTEVFRTFVQGSLAFVANGWAGLRVVDISNLTRPVQIGVYNPSLVSVCNVVVLGQQAFVITGTGQGLHSVDLSQWQLTATPTAADAGNYPIRITATDDVGGSDSSTFTLRVEGPPRMMGNISDQYAQIGQVLAFFVPQGLVQDPNLDVISFSAKLSNGTALPTWLTFNGGAAIFAGTPPEQPAQDLKIMVIATDNIAGSVNTTFNLRINHAPLISQAIAEQVAGIDLPYQFTVPQITFLDQDGDSFTYLARRSNGLVLPSWLNFNTTTRLFTGTPNISDAGSYDLDVFANDPYQGQARAGFRLLVEHYPRINRPIADAIVGVGQLFDQTIDVLSFIDDDDVNLNYAAYQTPNNALPSWLSFAPQTMRLYGTPSVSDLGVLRLRITASDSSGGSVYQEFNLTTTYFPAVITPISTPPPLRERRFFNLSISRQTFQDLDDPMLIYNASRSDGSALPAWLSFDANQLVFAGTPGIGDAGALGLSVNAYDSQGNQGRAPLDLIIQPNYPPEVKQQISNQVANVLESFNFFVPAGTFEDPNGDFMTYTARLSSGSGLPGWLKFDAAQLRFYGKPGRSDTGDFSDRVLDVDLVASDELSQASTNFRINVTGNSSLALFIKIGGPTFTLAGLAFGLYKKRSILLNRYKKERYQKVEHTIVVGEAFYYQLETPRDKTAKVQVKLEADAEGCVGSVMSLFKSSHSNLPGRAALPSWMEHDTEKNAIHGVVPDDVYYKELIIQVKDSNNITQEEVPLKVLPADSKGQIQMVEDVENPGLSEPHNTQSRSIILSANGTSSRSTLSALSITNSGGNGSSKSSQQTSPVDPSVELMTYARS